MNSHMTHTLMRSARRPLPDGYARLASGGDSKTGRKAVGVHRCLRPGTFTVNSWLRCPVRWWSTSPRSAWRRLSPSRTKSGANEDQVVVGLTAPVAAVWCCMITTCLEKPARLTMLAANNRGRPPTHMLPLGGLVSSTCVPYEYLFPRASGPQQLYPFRAVGVRTHILVYRN